MRGSPSSSSTAAERERAQTRQSLLPSFFRSSMLFGLGRERERESVFFLDKEEMGGERERERESVFFLDKEEM